MKTITRREDKYQYYKGFLAILMILVFLRFRQMITYAAEYTVTDANAVLYTAIQTGVYADPDVNAAAADANARHATTVTVWQGTCMEYRADRWSVVPH